MTKKEWHLKKATKTVYTVLKQIARWVPRGIVKEAAESHGIRYRTFDPWSHLVTLLVVQLSGEESLNGICDIAQAMSYEWDRAGMEIPRRNTLSNANAKRDPAMAEDVFWGLFRHLSALEPDFVSKTYPGYLARIRNHRLYALDSSTIQLVLNCIDWARHRRKKAAAKLHMLLDVASRLPAFAVVEEASHHDSVRAPDCTANLAKGDILVADRAYLDLAFLCALAMRGVFFTVRQKTNLLLDVAEELQEPCPGDAGKHTTQILADEKVRPATAASSAKYTADGGCLRRVTALVEVDGHMRRMVFLTNNFAWSAKTIAELYRARWEVETFFKELKQTCQIHDFIGYSENAVKWQVWAGLIAHLLLRFTRHLAKWKNSFSRLAGIVRGCLWLKKDLFSLLDTYGTAGGWVFRRKSTRPAWIQALLPFANAPNGTP